MGRYIGLKKQDVWELTLPQLNYYLKKCNEHIDFTIKVQTMGMGNLFGGGASVDTSDKESDDGEYEVATEEDMEWLSNIL